VCRDKNSDPQISGNMNEDFSDRPTLTCNQNIPPAIDVPDQHGYRPSRMGIRPFPKRRKDAEKEDVGNLILETLLVIPTLVDNAQEPPLAMLVLHDIADTDQGWLSVIKSLIQVIPIEDPLGPAVIALLLDECPLPTKDALCQLKNMVNFKKEDVKALFCDAQNERNVCILLGCLAEKLAGSESINLLTTDVLDCLIEFLHPNNHPSVILHSIVALEKFAQTSENKVSINEAFKKCAEHPLYLLENCFVLNASGDSESFKLREVGFCSKWCLDNLFLKDGRNFSYENEDRTNLNVMLNSNDVSEYLKLSSNGLKLDVMQHHLRV